MKQTRILHITRNLPPLIGGMERLNWHIADELSKRSTVHIIGPNGAATRPHNVEVTEVPLRPLPVFLLASAWKAVATARSFQPDIILAGSGLTAPAAWLAAQTCSARTFVYLHGLDAAVKHPIYRALWYPAIRQMDGVIVNSEPTANLARDLGVVAERISIVHPGVELPAAPQNKALIKDFRHRHQLGSNQLLLSVGRLTTRKGIREFVQHSLPTIVKAAPNTLLMIVGEAPSDSLHASAQTRASIQSIADAAGIGHHLRFLGMITSPQELALAYESASLHIFPVREILGDPEGFGMVAIEAAAHGLPTVAFSTGGIVDAIVDGQSGHLIPAGNYQTLAKATLNILTGDSTEWQVRTKEFALRFAWPSMGQKLGDVLKVGARSHI